MAYQTGTATDPADLLDKLRVFALANGFTVNFWGDRTAGTAPRKALQLTKGVLVGSFLSDSALGSAADPGMMIGTYCHNAYLVGNGTENQAGAAAKTYANNLTGPYQAYHFFCDNSGPNPYLYVVVETAAGTFKHFGIGRLDTIGAITTGLFNYGCRWNHTTNPVNTVSDMNSNYHAWPFDSVESNTRNGPSTQVRCDSDSITPRWFDSYNGTFGLRLSGGVRGTEPVAALGTQRALLYGPINASASQVTGRTVLAPCLLAVDRTANLQSPVGAPPNLRWVMLRYLDPGQTLALGPDTWKVFPVIRKNGSTGTENSGIYGYAYLVN